MTDDGGVVTTDDATLPATRPGLRTAALTVALVAVSLPALTRLDLNVAPSEGHLLDWWSVALIAIVAELMAFNLEFRREIYTFTFSEVTLILGLFLASPLSLVIGRLVGEAAFLILKERQPARKLTLNLASFLGECVVLLTVFQALGQFRDVNLPATWGAAFAAVFAAVFIGFVVVAAAVHWHGGQLKFRSILAIGSLTAPVNTSLALVTVILVNAQPWACLLLGGVAAFVLLSYRSYTALNQRFQSLTMLYDFTRLVSGSQRPEVVLESILVQAKDLFRADRAVIWLADEAGTFVGVSVDDAGRRSTVLADVTLTFLTQWFAESPDAMVVTTSTTDPRMRDVAAALDSSDCIVAPITESGTVIGLMAVTDRIGELNDFRPQEGPMFGTLANHASVALENGRLIARLHDQARQREHESLHDVLTGLPNRVMFAKRLRSAVDGLGPGGTVAVAVMDLNGFKEINDTLGHQAGDHVLAEVAGRIKRATGPDVFVARLGGDEFAVLFPKDWKRAQLEACAQSIRREVAIPLTHDGVRVSISVGIAIAPNDAKEGPKLLQRADVAMFTAKTGFGDGVSFYDPGTDTNSPRRLALSSDLPNALGQNEMSLLYQPKVRLADSTIVGVEALARWRHPRYGQVAPDEFIPLAERNGVIGPLSEFMLAQALSQAAMWQVNGSRWGAAVNLSMRNLIDADLVDLLDRLLRTTGVDPITITLEITETIVMSDTARTITMLERFAGLGVRLSVDDFGTGYSSLSYLQRLPVHEVKIDKSFVSSMATDHNSATIVRSVLDLAHNMGLSAVAEGVEDRETWDLLRALGCDEAQGYFLARPMTASELPQWADQLGRLHLDFERAIPRLEARQPAKVGV